MSTEVTSSAPLSHERANALIGAYVDGMLGEEERALMDAHFASCAECRSEREALAAAVESVSGLHKLVAPPDFADSVKSRIRRRSRGLFFAERKPKVRLELFSLVMLILLLVVYVALRLASPALLELR